MKNLSLLVLIIGTIMIFFGCQDENTLAPLTNQNEGVQDFLAKKPAPNLIGTMELDFTFGAWPEEPVWVGTITFEGYGECDGEYGIRFFHLSPFKEYSQVSPFVEYFEIYEGDIIYLAGPDEGVTILANKPPEPTKYRMNGEIDVANEPFEMWFGRNVHMSGVITWQNLGTPEEPVLAPATAPGTFRIN